MLILSEISGTPVLTLRDICTDMLARQIPVEGHMLHRHLFIQQRYNEAIAKVACLRRLTLVCRTPRVGWIICIRFAWVPWVALVGSWALQNSRRAGATMVIVVNYVRASGSDILWYSTLPIREVGK